MLSSQRKLLLRASSRLQGAGHSPLYRVERVGLLSFESDRSQSTLTQGPGPRRNPIKALINTIHAQAGSKLAVFDRAFRWHCWDASGQD